jgi:hypothetical protein
MNLGGIKGHLLSTAFLSRKLTGAVVDERQLPRRAALGPASSIRALLDAGMTPLLQSAALASPVEIESSSDLLTASVPAGDSQVGLVVVPWGAPLHAHWRIAVEQATRRSARCCLLFNGTSLRVIDVSRPNRSRFTEFDLASLDDDKLTTEAFRLVIGSLAGSFDALVRESEEFGVAVCRSLRDGVLSASSEVLAALVRPRQRSSLDSALEQSLTIVYRVLFLLFAESRGLVPLWHPLYRRSYSVDALVAASLRHGQARGLWDALRAIARLAHAGCRAGDLRVTPFNGRLFAPARTPLADRRDLDDERARRALISLATRIAHAGGR